MTPTQAEGVTAQETALNDAAGNAAQAGVAAAVQPAKITPANVEVPNFPGAQLNNIDNAANPTYNNTTTNGGDVRGGENSLAGVGDATANGASLVGESDRRNGARGGDGSSGQGLAGLGGVGVVNQQLRNTMTRKGIVNVGLQGTTDNAFFAQSINQAKADDPAHGDFVSPKTEGDLSEIEANGGKVFLSPDGSSGLVVTADGDIEAVFRNQKTGKRGSLPDLLISAIANGGKKLDCYGVGLVRNYERAGFIPVAQVDFNRGIAESEGWDVQKNGMPQVYVMMHNGDSAETVAQNFGNYHISTQAELDALPRFDENGYFTATEYRDNLLNDGESTATDVNTAPQVAEVAQTVANSTATQQERRGRTTASARRARAALFVAAIIIGRRLSDNLPAVFPPPPRRIGSGEAWADNLHLLRNFEDIPPVCRGQGLAFLSGKM